MVPDCNYNDGLLFDPINYFERESREIQFTIVFENLLKMKGMFLDFLYR